MFLLKHNPKFVEDDELFTSTFAHFNDCCCKDVLAVSAPHFKEVSAKPAPKVKWEEKDSKISFKYEYCIGLNAVFLCLSD